jgi:hypothetical protein
VNHETAAELLGAYALDAVEEEEAALVAAHVAECPRCQAELDEHREVAGMLGNAGGDPSRELWDRIASQATRPAGAPASPPLVVPGDGPRHHHRRPRRVGAPWLVTAAVVAAAAVAIALLAVQVGHLDGRVGQLTTIAGREGITKAEQAALLDPSTQRVELVVPSDTSQMAAEVVLVRGGLSFFVARDLGSLPPTRTYQLWAVSGTSAVSLGLLGRAPGVVPFVLNAVRPPTVLAVTIERSQGVVVPTSHPVAATPRAV